jgi:hypothetical protein
MKLLIKQFRTPANKINGITSVVGFSSSATLRQVQGNTNLFAHHVQLFLANESSRMTEAHQVLQTLASAVTGNMHKDATKQYAPS